jgi:hypothetical protein
MPMKRLRANPPKPTSRLYSSLTISFAFEIKNIIDANGCKGVTRHFQMTLNFEAKDIERPRATPFVNQSG